MTAAAFRMALRLRRVPLALTAAGMLAVIVMVGALFPAVGDSIGTLDLPKGVAELLGGADYGTLTGWMRSEIGAVYGPLVVGATAITAAAATLAGEEEDGVLGLTLAHPITRAQLVLAKAAAVATGVAIVALGTLAGLLLGVAAAGGGITAGHLAALTLHLACFGWLLGALALALGAATGRRAVASGGAAAFGVLSFLANGFAPLVGGLHWLQYVTAFHYYSGHDPVTRGVHLADLAVLVAATLVLTAVAVTRLQRRDLRR